MPLRAELIALTANHADEEGQWHWPAGIPGEHSSKHFLISFYGG